MDIFSAGFLVVGVSGASVLLLTILEKHGLKISKKIQKYLEMWPEIRKQYQNPKLCIFTKSQKRKKEFLALTKNIPHEIYCYNEI